MTDIIGNKGGGGHTPTEAKDNLISNQIVKTLFAVSEGDITEVENVYLNEVDSAGFDCTVESRLGYASQNVIKEFIDIEAPLEGFSSINLARNAPEEGTPTEYTVNIPYESEGVRLTFLINVMRRVEKDGDIVGSQLTITIYNKANASVSNANSQITTVVKKGKTSSGYTFDVELKRPETATSAAPWVITVIRNSLDNSSVKRDRVITWAAVTKLIYKSLSYPNTALVGVVMNDAKQFGGRVPEIMFRVKGKKIKVPDNYNPEARIYVGNWEGIFSTYLQYTNNPAWILYDLLTNTRYGLGIAEQDIDIYSLYALGKYADESILSGLTSQQGFAIQIPRYTFDYQFIERDTPQTALGQILSVCSANLIINEFGQLGVTYLHANMPISRNVTCQNVIDGIFNYSSSDLEQRSNLVNVTYNNGTYFGRTNTVTVQEQSLVSRYGLQPLDIALPGCYYEAQAIRKARSVLYINSYFTNIVTFNVLFEGLTYKIGDLIRVYDDYNQVDIQSGIITAVAKAVSTVVTFDRSITLAAGTYTVYLYDVQGVEHTKSLTYSVETTISSVTFSEPYDYPNGIDFSLSSNFIIAGATIPKIYRVSGIQKSDEEVYSITAVEFDFDIFTYINENIIVNTDTGDFVNANYFTVPAVTNLSVTPNSSSNGVTILNKLMVDWSWSMASTKNKAYFRLMWSKDDGTQTVIDKIPVTEFDIDNVTPGIYTITVWAVNPYTEILSAPVTLDYSYKIAAGTSTLYPPTNVRITGTISTYPNLSFATADVSISFDYNTSNTTVEDALYDYVVELWDSSGATLYEKYTVQPIARTAEPDPLDPTNATYIPLDGVFILPYAENVAQFGTPTRTFKLKIYSRDTLGDISVPIIVTVTNPAPVIATFDVYGTFDAVNINVPLPSDLDLKGFIYKRYAAALDTVPLETISSLNSNIVINVDTGVTYYYSVTATDTYGPGAESTKQSAMASPVEPDTYTYTGLIFKPNDPTNNYVSWTEFVATKNGTVSVTVSAGSAQWATGILYLYYVPGNATLQTSTSLVTAIGANGRVLATYKGGVDLANDAGRAFTSGDMILAGTVGANALVTNTAVITNSAQIGADISSSNYQATSPRDGWIIRQNGTAEFEGIAIYNGDNLILGAGNYNGTINNVAAGTITTVVANFNSSNDRNDASIAAPSIVSDGTAVDHTINSDGSSNISFEWSWAGAEGDIDGFRIYTYQSTSATAYTFGTTPANETVIVVPASKRAYLLYGAAADLYYTFGVQAYRAVDKDINAAGVIVSSLVKPSLAAENPYRPSATVAFTGDLTGTINNTSATAVVSNAANGNTAFSGTAKYRTTGAPTNNPSPTGLTITTNTNATCNVRLDWGAYTQGTNQADFLLLFWAKGSTAPTINDSSLAFNVNTLASYYIFEGVNPADTYSFGIAAARRTELGIEIGTIQAPISAPDWVGVTGGTPNFTANINSTAASTVVTGASNGTTAATGTANYRNDVAPTNNAVFGVVTTTATADGNVVVEVPYTYTQGAVKADQLFVYFREGGGTVVAADPAMATNAESGSVKFVLKPSTIYAVGLQAVRRTESGLVGTVISSYGPFTTTSSNFTGNLNGTAASTVVTNAAAVTTKLSKSTADTLSAVLSVDTTLAAGIRVSQASTPLVWNAAGTITSGKGIALTPKGIIGYNGTATTFSVDSTTGNASFGGDLAVGSSPAVSGTTMTGSGAAINSGGTFAIGNGTTNINFNGSTITLNGDVVATANVKAGNITAMEGSNSLSATTLPIPAATALSYGTETDLGLSYTYPATDISVTRIFLVSFTINSTDTAGGNIILRVKNSGVTYFTEYPSIPQASIQRGAGTVQSTVTVTYLVYFPSSSSGTITATGQLQNGQTGFLWETGKCTVNCSLIACLGRR